jgi:hypothetical protein
VAAPTPLPQTEFARLLRMHDARPGLCFGGAWRQVGFPRSVCVLSLCCSSLLVPSLAESPLCVSCPQDAVWAVDMELSSVDRFEVIKNSIA